jgi:molybdopterin converting factor small subunit
MSGVRVAVNQEMADLSHRVCDQDEVAVFPPMTGGSRP